MRKNGFKRKRFRRRRRFRRRKRRSMPRLPLGGLPTSLKVRLRYVERIDADPGISGLIEHDFRANGMYDPKFAAGGHQPDGFDQMMAYYNHFTVVGAKINMRPLYEFTSNIDPIMYGIGLFPAPAGISEIISSKSLFQTEESAILESRLVRGYRQNSIFGGAGKKYNVFTKKFSAKKFFGTTAIVNKSPYRGDVTADPAEAAFFNCWIFNPAGEASSNQAFIVTIEYIAVLTEPKVIAKS